MTKLYNRPMNFFEKIQVGWWCISECWSEWVFINTGFPMNHAKGQTARDAVIAAMRAK